MSEQNNDWNNYSRLVLKELETLAIGISNLAHEIQDVKSELALLKDRESKVDKIIDWKEKMTEIASPSQFATCIKEIEELKQFKTKAITIFVVVQTLITIAISLIKFIQ